MIIWRLKFISKPFCGFTKRICGTGDSFETGQPKVLAIWLIWKVMLGKSLPKVRCAFDFGEYITDGADDTAHLDWEENLLLGAQKLFAFIKIISKKRSANLPIFFILAR
jgi:adenosylhomocysteine nucleosidase